MKRVCDVPEARKSVAEERIGTSSWSGKLDLGLSFLFEQ